MDSDEEAAQTTADFVRNNKERRSRLDDVSFGDDGKTRDSAGAARASDRRRAVAARPPAGGRGVDRWAGQADSDEESRDGAPPVAGPRPRRVTRLAVVVEADVVEPAPPPLLVVADEVGGLLRGFLVAVHASDLVPLRAAKREAKDLAGAARAQFWAT